MAPESAMIRGILLALVTVLAFPAEGADTVVPACPMSGMPREDARRLVTPAEYLACRSAPQFRERHSLLPLTRWGWTLGENAMLQFSRWGYALDLGEASPATVAQLKSPTSLQFRIVALVRAHPLQYKLSILMPRIWQERVADDSAYIHGNDGKPLPPGKWSPGVSTKLLENLSDSAGVEIRHIEALAPISVILNGGERGLDVPIIVQKTAADAPDILAAKGAESWSEYVSRRKAFQESFFTAAAHQAAPGAIYIFYPTGNQYTPD